MPYQKPSIGKWLAPLVGLAFSFFLLLLHFRLNDLKELEWRRPVLSVFRRQVVRPFLLPSRRPRIPLPSFAENPLAAAERLSFRFPAAEENGRDRQTDRQTDRPTHRQRESGGGGGKWDGGLARRMWITNHTLRESIVRQSVARLRNAKSHMDGREQGRKEGRGISSAAAGWKEERRKERGREGGEERRKEGGANTKSRDRRQRRRRRRLSQCQWSCSVFRSVGRSVGRESEARRKVLLDDEDDDGGFWRENEGDQQRSNKTGPSLRPGSPRAKSWNQLPRKKGKGERRREDSPLFTDLRCYQEGSYALYPRFKNIEQKWPA